MRSTLPKPHGEELAEAEFTASILSTRDEHIYLYASRAFIEHLLVLGKWVLVLWKELDLVGLIKKLIYSSSTLSSNALWMFIPIFDHISGRSHGFSHLFLVNFQLL